MGQPAIGANDGRGDQVLSRLARMAERNGDRRERLPPDAELAQGGTLWPDHASRRAATSIPANIPEGYGRHSTGSYVQFLKIAQGSLQELETHLILVSPIDITTEAVEPVLLQTDDLGKALFWSI
jgi:23S rRNA-intervening sequence protein